MVMVSIQISSSIDVYLRGPTTIILRHLLQFLAHLWTLLTRGRPGFSSFKPPSQKSILSNRNPAIMIVEIEYGLVKKIIS